MSKERAGMPCWAKDFSASSTRYSTNGYSANFSAARVMKSRERSLNTYRARSRGKAGRTKDDEPPVPAPISRTRTGGGERLDGRRDGRAERSVVGVRDGRLLVELLDRGE